MPSTICQGSASNLSTVMPWKPASSNASTKPSSVSAPEIQPDQRRSSFFSASGLSSSEIMSETATRPPTFNTRNISAKSCFFFVSDTRFNTQFETITSTELSGIIVSSDFMRRISASMASMSLADFTGFLASHLSRASKSNFKSSIWPRRNSTFA